MKLNWFKSGVIYQIYPRSFKDSNGDGIGDLKGITSKIDYLKSLNVDIIWISPIFESPNKDNGYDVSDYCSIMPEFGTMSDFDELLEEAHSKGLKIVLDLVPNHTSDKHHWFQEAKKSKDNPYRDYYIWREPKTDGSPPNNWPSFFSGPAWTLDENTGEYYLHLFTKYQPDLNWENPKVRESIYEVMRFWLDKGIDGFRMDVVTLLSKEFKDIKPGTGFRKIIEDYYANGPKIHDYLHEMNEKVMKNYDAFSMGEGVGVNQDNAHLYVADERQELDMIYHFDILENNIVNGKYDEITSFDLLKVKDIFRNWQKVIDKGGWITNALGNHDFARLVSRFGNDGKYRNESAKMLITLMATQNGTLNIYQGDEIGMTNINLKSIEEVNDIQSINFYNENLEAKKFTPQEALQMINNEGRDNARTPMQWNDHKNAGFTTNEPWLLINPNYELINVKSQIDDSNSILNYYKNILKLKRENAVFTYGKITEVESDNKDVYAYQKRNKNENILVFLSFSETEIDIEYKFDIKNYDMLINNYSFVTKSFDILTLLPYQALILRLKNN
jgi:oligo-1,6-glucosidase